MAKIYGVTTVTTESNDKRIGIIKENSDGNFAYSTDGLTYKTVSGGSDEGSKGYDFVIAPSSSGATSADLVLTGTDDQIAINKFLTDVVKAKQVKGQAASVIKFLSGTINLTGTITIPCNVKFVGSGYHHTMFDYDGPDSDNYMFVMSGTGNEFIEFRDLQLIAGSSSSQTCAFASMSNLEMCTFSHCAILTNAKTIPSILLNTIRSVVIDNCEIYPGIPEGGTVVIKANKVSDGIIKNSKIVSNNIYDGNVIIPDFVVSDCTFDGFINLLGYSEADYDSDASSNPSLKSIKNCQFGYDLDLDSIINSLNKITVQTENIDSCTFNIPLDMYKYKARNTFASVDIMNNCISTRHGIIYADKINNCEFRVEPTGSYDIGVMILDASGTINNCVFSEGNFKITSVYHLYNCIFNYSEVQISNANTIYNCTFEDITMEGVSAGRVIRADRIVNCIFDNSATVEQPIPSLYTDLLSNCTFNTIITPKTFISTKDGVDAKVCDCTFDTITTPTDKANSIYLISGFTVVENCKFSSIQSSGSEIFSMLYGGNYVSNISVDSNDETIGVFYRYKTGNRDTVLLENVNILSSGMNKLLSANSRTGFDIIINNVTMEAAETITLPDSGNNFIIDGLVISGISTETSTSLLTAKKLRYCSISNVTIGTISTPINYYLLNTPNLSNETHLRFSNIHILNASNTFNLFNITDTTTIGTNAILCDNISISGPSPAKDLEDLFPTAVHPVYSNYSYVAVDSAVQLQITNYSSNAAVKFDDGKAYIYDSSTGNWMQIQLVTTTTA